MNANKNSPALAKEGVDMNKRLRNLCSISALLLLGLAVLLFAGPDTMFDNARGLLQRPASYVENHADYGQPYASLMNAIGGICALLLMGYLFWVLYRKFQTDHRAELIAPERSLYNITLATGRTEYDLFCQSAEEWSVPVSRIDQDFTRYMTDQIMPYYVKDFVRRNQANIDEPCINKKELKPASRSDWAKALLVFPGSVLLLLIMTNFLV